MRLGKLVAGSEVDGGDLPLSHIGRLGSLRPAFSNVGNRILDMILQQNYIRVLVVYAISLVSALTVVADQGGRHVRSCLVCLSFMLVVHVAVDPSAGPRLPA